MSARSLGIIPSVYEQPRQLRTKLQTLWRGTMPRYLETEEKTDAYTPVNSQSGTLFLADAFFPDNYTFTADISKGWFCEIVQVNVGNITCVAGAGATINGRDGVVFTQGPWDVKRVTCIRNTDGASAEFVVSPVNTDTVPPAATYGGIERPSTAGSTSLSLSTAWQPLGIFTQSSPNLGLVPAPGAAAIIFPNTGVFQVALTVTVAGPAASSLQVGLGLNGANPTATIFEQTFTGPTDDQTVSIVSIENITANDTLQVMAQSNGTPLAVFKTALFQAIGVA